MAASAERDESENVKYGDLGLFLRDAIKDRFKRAGMDISSTLARKKIDPAGVLWNSIPASTGQPRDMR